MVRILDFGKETKLVTRAREQVISEHTPVDLNAIQSSKHVSLPNES
jgi:hypothetical protein